MQVHNHSPEQQEVLKRLIEQKGQQLLGMRFNEPKDDDLMIRQHAYIKGQFDLLVDLMNDNYPDPKENMLTDTDVQAQRSNTLSGE